MKKLIIILAALFACAFTTGCPQQILAKAFGGTHEIVLKENTRLLNITWKQDVLWILTREREENETPRTYSYKESSVFGVLEGEIIIKEK